MSIRAPLPWPRPQNKPKTRIKAINPTKLNKNQSNNNVKSTLSLKLLAEVELDPDISSFAGHTKLIFDNG